MRILILYLAKDNLAKLRGDHFDLVFSLDDAVTEEDIKLRSSWGGNKDDLFKYEQVFRKILAKSLDLAVEYYTDFVAEWPEIYVDRSKRNVKELLQWNRMSVWWISKIMEKNPPSANHSYYLLAYLLFLKEILCKFSDITVATDDKIFGKAIRTNFPNLSVVVVKNLRKKIRLIISETVKQYLRVMFYFVQLEVFKRLIGKGDFESISTVRNNVFFVTLYPINWVWQGNCKVDRLYSTAPLIDCQFDFKSAYLISFAYLPLRLLLRPKTLRANLAKLSKEAQRPVVFLEPFILRKDLVRIYFNMIEHIRFFIIKRKKKFRSSFKFRGLNVGPLFLPIIFRGIKEQKKFGIAFQRFAEQFPFPQKYVTYADTRIQGRVLTHCIKMANENNISIGVQHTTYYKNKLYPYHRRKEIEQLFNFDSIQRSPIIDYFCVQGSQYEMILKQFYPQRKIRTIGCLKYDSYYEIFQRKEQIRKEVADVLDLKPKQKLIFIAPSTNDIRLLLSFLKNVFSIFNGTKLILKPHPVTDIEIIKRGIIYQGIKHKIKIVSDLPTPHLLLAADLVICADSTVAIEAPIFGSQPIRVTNPKRLPPYDIESEIPCFSDPDSFVEWYEKWSIGLKRIEGSLVEKYLYKIDGKAKNRLWRVIQESKINIARKNYICENTKER